MGVKLWHDDVRPAPEGWVWARTNDEAKDVLSTGKVTHCSLDHDLGNHDLPPGTCDLGPNSGSGMPQKGDETGMHLVEWMLAEGIIPGWIRVHAWSPCGSRMADALKGHGATVIRHPFRPGEVIGV